MANLRVTDVRTFIPASDFEQSKRFYAALGWETRDVGPKLALVKLGDEQHLYIQDYYLKEVAENSMFHVTVEDVQAWHTHISTVLRDGDFPKARVQPACRQEYGATVVFVHDPTGVLFHLCQWDD